MSIAEDVVLEWIVQLYEVVICTVGYDGGPVVPMVVLHTTV